MNTPFKISLEKNNNEYTKQQTLHFEEKKNKDHTFKNIKEEKQS